MKLALVQPDTHYPYEDSKAVELLTKVAKDLKPDFFINLGDSLDFYQISKFSKDPARKNGIDEDMDLFRRDHCRISNVLPKKCRKIFIEGNHEARLIKYVWERAPEVASLVRSIDDYCMLTANDWEYFKYGKYFRLGDTLFMHGAHCGLNVGLNQLRKYGLNVVHGHDHAAGITWFRNARDGIFNLNCGHLSNQKEQGYLYAGVANWQLGFGLVEFSDNYYQAWPHFIPIHNNRCVVYGKEYKA